MSLAHLLAASARVFPDRPAVVMGTRALLDYAGLGRAVAGLAAGLRGLGLRPGDRVLLAMGNGPDCLTVLFACWWAGLAAVPANARLRPEEVAALGEDAGARLVVADDALAHPLAVRLGLPVLRPGTAELARLVASDPVAPHEAEPEDLAWVFYTSGTTGRPKGAMLTQRNLLAMAVAYLADVDALTPRDALLHYAATSHASGLFALSFVAKAGANVLPEAGGWEAEEFRRLASAQGSLTFFAPSPLLMRMAEAHGGEALPGLRTILTGAGPIYAADLRRALAAFGPRLWNGYGQGESPCTIAAMPKDLLWRAREDGDEARLASVGIARTGIRLRLLREDGSEAEPGETGEVAVRGETVMAGYLGRPDATAEALRDGWLMTGDLGRMDGRGFLTLLDRRRDLIKTGGLAVQAREVEEVLLLHPGVAEAAVIAAPHPEWGEGVLALVVPRPGAAPDPAALDALCLARLARWKRPRRYLLVAALPRNAAGKVLKAELRRVHAGAFAGA